MSKLKVLDLFSGIGGFSLGLERTGGFETVAFCEIEKFPQKVLKKHWPEVPIYEDVRELTEAKLTSDGITGIDVITGGFPCQDISAAGKRAGIHEGTRSGLWSEIVRLVGELRPSYVIVENVAALLSGPYEQRGGWFGRILADLASLGYDAEWENIPASALGAPHRRERVWVIAYTSEVGRLDSRPFQDFDTVEIAKIRVNAPSKGLAYFLSSRLYNGGDFRDHRKDDGLSQFMDRIGACGNSVIPQAPEIIGHAILEAEHEREAAA